MDKIITISREFGSGGREIGFRLAERLGIPFYDREIISMAAEDSNIAEEVFHVHDEKIVNQAHNYHSITPLSVVYEIPVSDQIFVAQSQVIKKLALLGSCVMIGRCSDILLDDSFDVFICASTKVRLERLMKLEPDAKLRTMETRIRQIDTKRREYYQYYSGNQWGNPKNYHICLNSSKLGIESCVDLIVQMLNQL